MRLIESRLEALERIVTHLGHCPPKPLVRPTSNRTKRIVNPIFNSDVIVYEVTPDIEDIIVGITRSFRAEYTGSHRGEVVDPIQMCKVFIHMAEITSQGVQQYLQVSQRQAQRYLQVAEACTQHLEHI